MRLYRVVAFAFFCCLCFAQSNPQRDVEAVNVLQSSYNATLGGAGSTTSVLETINSVAVSDGTTAQTTASSWLDGSKTIFAPVSGSGSTTHLWPDGNSCILDSDGFLTPLPRFTAAGDGNVYVPFLSTLQHWNDSTVGLIYVGLEQLNGASVHHIQLIRDFSGVSDTTDIYIDSSALTPTRLIVQQHDATNVQNSEQVTIDYANYQSQFGLLLPFSINSSLNGSLFLQETVQAVQQNAAVDDGATECGQ